MNQIPQEHKNKSYRMISTRLLNVSAGNLADCWSLLGRDQLCGTIKSQNLKTPERNQTGAVGIFFFFAKKGQVFGTYIY